MNKIMVIAAALIIYAACPIGAQPKQMPKEDKIQRLVEKLNLNSDQTAKIKKIYNASDEKIKIINEKITEQHKKLMNEIKSIVDKEDEQILNLLDKKQKEKYKEMKKERDSRPPIRMDQEPRGPKPEEMEQKEK